MVQWCKILCGLWSFRHSWIQILIVCHQEPVSCHLLALLSSMLALFSVVSPQVVAPSGSGLISYQLGSPRGLRAPLLESSGSSQWTRLGRVFILNKSNGEMGFLTGQTGVMCSSQSVSSEPDQQWGRDDSLKKNKGLGSQQQQKSKTSSAPPIRTPSPLHSSHCT